LPEKEGIFSVQSAFAKGTLCRRLISLLEIMQKFNAGELMHALDVLIHCSSGLATFDVMKIESCPVEMVNMMAAGLKEIAAVGSKIELDASLMLQIAELLNSLESGRGDYRSLVLETTVKSIANGLQNNLSSRLFMFVPADRAQYFDDSNKWPNALKFSSATQFEMQEAGNCYAAGRDTACVFHAMRVAEHGLRLLAKKLRVRLTNKKANCPIDFADWEKVITEIKNKITAVRLLPVGPKRQEKLEFFSDAGDHSLFMKDIWRNNVSHARRPYNQPEALGVMERVRDFMKFIGERL
jgi:hypothetical protein